MEAPVLTQMELSARIVPTNVVFVSIVTSLVTCQKTLHACPTPFRNETVLLGAVVRAEPTWKIQRAFGSPCALRVRVPVRPMVLVAL
jgi:hypothetical protein